MTRTENGWPNHRSHDCPEGECVWEPWRREDLPALKADQCRNCYKTRYGFADRNVRNSAPTRKY